VAAARHLLAGAVPAGEPVGDRQRRERQRDQGGDPVTGVQPERRVGADRLDGADEHAAGAGDRIVHLPPFGNDPDHLGADGVAVAAVSVVEVAETGRVQVEALHRHPCLVGGYLGAVVQPPRRLRQHPGGFQDPVQPDG
jgi:hypothetical protein